MAKPDKNDWYETVKVNYGIRPDGSKDFPELPAGFETNPIRNIMIFGGKKKCRTLGINLEISHYIGQQKSRWFPI
jgi:hypothetical protein